MYTAEHKFYNVELRLLCQ